MNKNNKKGFTLAELLIVVAIIGILVAIAIPVFTAQLNKAKEASDVANVRSLYAQLQADAMTGDSQTLTGTIGEDSTIVYGENTYKFNFPSYISYTAAAGDSAGEITYNGSYQSGHSWAINPMS